jgi:hypothetical protein
MGAGLRLSNCFFPDGLRYEKIQPRICAGLRLAHNFNKEINERSRLLASTSSNLTIPYSHHVLEHQHE